MKTIETLYALFDLPSDNIAHCDGGIKAFALHKNRDWRCYNLDNLSRKNKADCDSGSNLHTYVF